MQVGAACCFCLCNSMFLHFRHQHCMAHFRPNINSVKAYSKLALKQNITSLPNLYWINTHVSTAWLLMHTRKPSQDNYLQQMSTWGNTWWNKHEAQLNKKNKNKNRTKCWARKMIWWLTVSLLQPWGPPFEGQRSFLKKINMGSQFPSLASIHMYRHGCPHNLPHTYIHTINTLQLKTIKTET